MICSATAAEQIKGKYSINQFKRYIMKQTFILIIIALFAATQIGCSKEESEPKYGGALKSKYLIHNYIIPNEIEMQQYRKTTPVILINFTGYRYSLNGSAGLSNYAEKVGASDFVYESIGSLPFGYIPKEGNPDVIPVDKKELSEMVEENLEKFEQFANQYGDTCFNKQVVPYSNQAIPDNIVEIDIVCNEDYNAEHKQGSSLSDITDFYCGSFFEYIQNKYKEEKSIVTQFMRDNYIGFDAYDVKYCPTTNVNGENIQLFDPYCYLGFNTLPEKSGTYTFEVTIKLSGKTLKNTVTMEF